MDRILILKKLERQNFVVRRIDGSTNNKILSLTFFYSFYDSKVPLAFQGSLVFIDESLSVVLDVLWVEQEPILELVLKPVVHSTFVVDRVAAPKLHQNLFYKET